MLRFSPQGPTWSFCIFLLLAQAATSNRHLLMYVCPSDPQTPSPSFGHSSCVRQWHVTEPSKFPVQAALFLQSFARSHGPVRTNDKMITSFTNFAKDNKISYKIMEATKITQIQAGILQQRAPITTDPGHRSLKYSVIDRLFLLHKTCEIFRPFL